jgi:hypothetical protein
MRPAIPSGATVAIAPLGSAALPLPLAHVVPCVLVGGRWRYGCCLERRLSEEELPKRARAGPNAHGHDIWGTRQGTDLFLQWPPHILIEDRHFSRLSDTIGRARVLNS